MMVTQALVIVCFISQVMCQNDIFFIARFCKLLGGYGRPEGDALDSFMTASKDSCSLAGAIQGSTWTSYDPLTKECRLFGTVDITQGVIAMDCGSVEHYSPSACYLQDPFPNPSCYEYLDASSYLNGYTGFVCREGPFGGAGGGPESDITARKMGGPITKLTIYEHFDGFWNQIVLSMLNEYGGSHVFSHGFLYGGSGINEVVIPYDDCIYRIEVKADMFLNQLTFYTIQGDIFGPYGEDAGTYYDVVAPFGTCLSFMDFRDGIWIDAIAFIFETFLEFPGLFP